MGPQCCASVVIRETPEVAVGLDLSQDEDCGVVSVGSHPDRNPQGPDGCFFPASSTENIVDVLAVAEGVHPRVASGR